MGLRNDGSYALVQVWTTNYTEKFRQEFHCRTDNPDPKWFLPQAVDEFRATVVKLFGAEANHHDILYCHRATLNPNTVYVGTAGALQMFLRANPKVLEEMHILELVENGFVCRTLNDKMEEGTQEFQFPGRDTKVALYMKQGWDGVAYMACITPWDQFEKG